MTRMLPAAGWVNRKTLIEETDRALLEQLTPSRRAAASSARSDASTAVHPRTASDHRHDPFSVGTIS